jgi:deaminated glutathione amidase
MKFVAAAVQMVASDDKAANLQRSRALDARGCWSRRASGRVAGSFFLARREEARARVCRSDPRTFIDGAGELTRELGIYLLAGSLLEAIPGREKVYNTSLLFDPSGNIVANYRKIHLFDVDLANGTSLRESATREHGDGVVAASTELWCDGH